MFIHMYSIVNIWICTDLGKVMVKFIRSNKLRLSSLRKHLILRDYDIYMGYGADIWCVWTLVWPTHVETWHQHLVCDLSAIKYLEVRGDIFNSTKMISIVDKKHSVGGCSGGFGFTVRIFLSLFHSKPFRFWLCNRVMYTAGGG